MKATRKGSLYCCLGLVNVLSWLERLDVRVGRRRSYCHSYMAFIRQQSMTRKKATVEG